MSETMCGRILRQGQSSAALPVQKSYMHGRLLLNRARRELAAMQRLSEISPTTPLVNEAWRLLLMTLAENLRGGPAYSEDLADRTGVRSDITLRYLRVLESDRLILLGEPGPKGHAACIADEGLLWMTRYFLPEAANE